MSTRVVLPKTDCVRCGLPFSVRPEDEGETHGLLCHGCHDNWVKAGCPDELPPMSERWRPVRPVPVGRPFRAKRGDARRRATDPDGYRP